MSSKKVRNGQHAGVWSQAVVEMAEPPDGPGEYNPTIKLVFLRGVDVAGFGADNDE